MRRGTVPKTRVSHPEPKKGSEEWIQWAAWADRVTFEEIERITGMREPDVIRWMRKNVPPGQFRRWRKRVSQSGLKHEKRFQEKRRGLRKSSRNLHD